jgi:hypothetical protein
VNEQQQLVVVFAAIVAALVIAVALAVAHDEAWIPAAVVTLLTVWVVRRMIEPR